MPEHYIANAADLTAVADAIRTKGGTTDTLTFPDGFVSAIGNLGSGGTVQPKDVNFIDYDGTVLHSYTVAEAAALTALPPLPSHDGLTCQGWNWSLADIKALGRAVTVGAMYITDDGKTRIYIHLEEEWKSPVLGCCPNGTVTVDWGDGTTPDILTGTSTLTIEYTSNHTYAAPGDYIIELEVDGTMAIKGEGANSSDTSALLRDVSWNTGYSYVYANVIQRVEIGNGVVLVGENAFRACNNLSDITIPQGVSSIGNKAFRSCNALSGITIPDSVTSIGDLAFYFCSAVTGISIPKNATFIGNDAFGYCYILRNIAIPNGVTSIKRNMFAYTYVLTNLAIPDGVEEIGDNAFEYSGLYKIKIPGSVKTIGNNTFKNCQALCKVDFTAASSIPSIGSRAFYSTGGGVGRTYIYVPIALYEEWIAATNWAAYADHIIYVGTPFYLNVSSDNGGTVTPTGQVLAPPGCTRTLKIVPDGTHELSDITLDGTSVKSAVIYVDGSSNAWTVETVDGASYGFALNTNGYYESQNKGKSNSAAVCKIAITVAVETAMSLDIINSGESNYDYGLLGAVDQVLKTTSTADSGVAWSGKGKSSTDVVNVPFTIPAGTHYIYAKFIKDGSGDQGNDSLQFKVNLPTESYWSYTIENVQSDHDIVVTFGAKGA